MDSTPADLSLTRVFAAPRTLVWSVWTDPAQAAQWWGPQGFTTPVYEADLRPGGAIRVHMRAPDGTIYPSEGAFVDVVPPERLVMTGAVEMNGSVVFEARTTITFEEQGDNTTIGVHQAYTNVAPAAAGALAGAPAGWNQQLDKLDAYLAALA